VMKILARPRGKADAVEAEAVPSPAGSADRMPTIVFIAGAGRSGSTLLERALGAIPGFVNVGELIDIFRRDAPRKERCGCGQAFATCPFWEGVGKRTLDHWDSEQLAAVQRLKGRISRQRHLPRLLAMPLAGRSFRADVATYGTSYARLYQAIAAEADAACVVDASKWPVQALALARAGLDVRVVHLIRDVRGVAHSLGKRGVARPHALSEKDVMWTKRPMAAAVRWVTYQSQVELLPLCGVPVTRVRYEDFVCQPRHTVEQALADLGLPCRPAQLEHLRYGGVTLGPSHGIAGNPSRFRYGEIALHVDEAWRAQMSRRDRILVTAIGLPLLVRYRRRPPRGRDAAVNGAVSPGDPAPEGDWPLVSVIVPTRGRPELVREAIAAVVGQTYLGDVECIVVHDQEEPDQRLASLGTARHRVRVVANTRKPGLAGARNTGLSLAGGEFIATCDDDDLWHPDKLQTQITRLLDEPDLLVVGSGMRLLLPGNKTLDWPGRSERISYELLLRNRVKELHSSTLVMRRDAVVRVGRYDEELPHGYAEDYDWVLRAARTGSIGVVTRPLADVRRDAGSWYQDGAENKALALEYLLAKHQDIAASHRGHARILGQIAFARSSMGERGPALRYAVRGLLRWPGSPHPYIALVHIATGIHPRHMLRTARLFRRDMA
jgi:glycosyltransferase involved in cell wall biosynthesis